MPAERKPRAREPAQGQRWEQWQYESARIRPVRPAPVRPRPNSPVRVFLLGLIPVISLAITVLALRFLYKGIRQFVGFLLTLAIRMGLLLASPGVFIYRKLTGSVPTRPRVVPTRLPTRLVKPTGAGVTEIQHRTTTRPSIVVSSTTETSTTSTPTTVTTTETSTISLLVPSITSISTTITITEQCSCPTHTPAASLPPTSSEINLSSSLFWSIYIPLAGVVIAIVGSHIYFHRAQLLEHKRLHKEIKSIKADKGKAVEAQITKAEVVAVEKIKWYRAPPARARGVPEWRGGIE